MYDLTVAAFIIHQDRILLVSHKKLNSWVQVGGHVELNEDPEMALWREIFEETGLRKSDLTLIDDGKERPFGSLLQAKSLPLPFDLSVYVVGNSTAHKHIELSYLLLAHTEKVVCNRDESNDIRWFSLQELEAIQAQMFPNVYAQCLFALHKFAQRDQL